LPELKKSLIPEITSQVSLLEHKLKEVLQAEIKKSVSVVESKPFIFYPTGRYKSNFEKVANNIHEIRELGTTFEFEVKKFKRDKSDTELNFNIILARLTEFEESYLEM